MIPKIDAYAPLTLDMIGFDIKEQVSKIKPNEHNYQYKMGTQIVKGNSGLFSEVNNKEFSLIENKFMTKLYSENKVFVMYFDKKFTLGTVGRVGEQNDEVQELEIGSNNFNNGTRYKVLNNVHGILVKGDETTLTGFYLWWSMLHELSKMLKGSEVAIKNASKIGKIQITTKNKDIKKKIIIDWEDMEDPFGGITLDNIELSGLEDIKVDKLDVKSNIIDIFTGIAEYTKFGYVMYGQALPQQNRPSGKADGETIIDYQRSITNEIITLKQLRNFSIMAKKLGKIDLQFERTVELENFNKPEESENENESKDTK